MYVIRDLDENHWKDFVDKHPYGNIFHTPEMFQVFARAKGYQPEVWATVDKHSQILALFLPAHITLVNGLLQRFTTRSVVYGGILFQEDESGEEAVRLLLDSYTKGVKGRSLFTELRNFYDSNGLNPLLESRGYIYEEHLNYLIELNRPAEEILQNIGSRTRKKIRKGLREGHVQISEVTSPAELVNWYKILQETYDKAQVLLADRSLFEAAFDILYRKGMAKFLLAQVKGVPAACSLELPYKKAVYGWYGGSDRRYSEYVPNEMLIWHILQWGANNGFRFYDFGGAGKPNEEYGVRDFKAKFNGQLVCFGRNICVHAPISLALSRWGYQILRRFS